MFIFKINEPSPLQDSFSPGLSVRPRAAYPGPAPGEYVLYYCRTYYKAVRVGGGGGWRTCAMRDDEPRPVWMSLLITN